MFQCFKDYLIILRVKQGNLKEVEADQLIKIVIIDIRNQVNQVQK